MVRALSDAVFFFIVGSLPNLLPRVKMATWALEELPLEPHLGASCFHGSSKRLVLEVHFAQMKASEGLLIVTFDLRCYTWIRL